MIEALFAFAILHGGYTEFCRVNECKPSAVVMVEPSAHVPARRNGHYFNGNSYVKTGRGDIATEITTVHELTHHLQHLSNRYHQYRGICNQWRAEKEAYEVGEAYAESKGYKTNYQSTVSRYKEKCDNAVAAGLVRDPQRVDEIAK